MSKASEWAAAPVNGKRLDHVDSTGRLIALVSNEPRMGLGYRRWLAPAEALRLAAWIIDTFDEPGDICATGGGAHRLHIRRDTTGTGTYSTCLECGKAVRV